MQSVYRPPGMLYGTNINQPYVWYDQDSYNYSKWIFAFANNAQRNPITRFSLLGDHIDCAAYRPRLARRGHQSR